MTQEQLKTDGSAFVTFLRPDGILVFMPILGGSATLEINEHHIATKISGTIEFQDPKFGLAQFVDTLGDAQIIQDKLHRLTDEQIQHLNDMAQ